MKLIIIGALLLTLFSCAYDTGLEADLIALNNQVNETLTYKSDMAVHGVAEYFQTPTESMELLTGDCEDYTLLFMWRVKHELGLDSNFVTVNVHHIAFHAIAKVNGIYYDPTNRLVFDTLPDGWEHVLEITYWVIPQLW
jgi:hypothetical protein